MSNGWNIFNNNLFYWSIRRKIDKDWWVVAIVLLWFGCWCNGAVIEFFGVSIGDSASSGQSGYY
ncbi:MAG: hypothetical protein HWN81_02440 [Candidatus Lokiarchaeota archaeon]|nr:hypothetical protein [Candidatus Lokiarchaeota archaeon]